MGSLEHPGSPGKGTLALTRRPGFTNGPCFRRGHRSVPGAYVGNGRAGPDCFGKRCLLLERQPIREPAVSRRDDPPDRTAPPITNHEWLPNRAGQRSVEAVLECWRISDRPHVPENPHVTVVATPVDLAGW